MMNAGKQKLFLTIALLLVGCFLYSLVDYGWRKQALFLIGCGLGLSLFHGAFGFVGAYRSYILQRDLTGIAAQMIMLVAAMLLFAPFLSSGEAFGSGVGGAVAPVSLSMALGAFIFGVGMQLGGGCASGTLYTAGSLNIRMMLVLVFFCIGAFWGSLDLGWWQTLPDYGVVSLGHRWGWPVALSVQVIGLCVIWLILSRLGGKIKRPLGWEGGFQWKKLLVGPWPLVMSAGLLALLNWATLVVAGHPWTITWGFSLWAAKGAMLMGWDPMVSDFWASGFPMKALNRSILADTTSVMNIGVLLGAMIAASLSGKAGAKPDLKVGSLLAVVVGGLAMGYGARLAYGCNIGAFFSGVASTSLHGWVWIAMAVPGNIIGVRLRPLFGL